MLNFDTFVLSKKISQQDEQPKDSCGAEDKYSLVQQIHVQTVIALLVRKNWMRMPSAVVLQQAGRLADKIQVDFEILKPSTG